MRRLFPLLILAFSFGALALPVPVEATTLEGTMSEYVDTENGPYDPAKYSIVFECAPATEAYKPDGGSVVDILTPPVTEFEIDVAWAGPKSTIKCRALAQINETGEMSDPTGDVEVEVPFRKPTTPGRPSLKVKVKTD